jgi:hypothetical protein
LLGDDMHRRASKRLAGTGVTEPDEAWHALGLAGIADSVLIGEIPTAEGQRNRMAAEIASRAWLASIHSLGHRGEHLVDALNQCLAMDPAPAWLASEQARSLAGMWLQVSDVSAVPEREAGRLASLTIREVRLMLRAARKPLRRLASARRRGVFRAALLLVVALALIIGAGVGIRTLMSRPDLAKGKPFATSSTHPEFVRPSPGDRNKAPALLFWTAEQPEPWFEIDLGRPTQVSALQIRNRRDCCVERAIPLLVELSDNRTTWKTVGRQDKEFAVWEPRFDLQPARYVRLRVGRQSMLHLESVKVFRK